MPSAKRDVLVAPWFEKRAQVGNGRYTLYRLRESRGRTGGHQAVE